MNLSVSPNNERGAPPIFKENHGPNCLRDHVMLLEMPNNQELKEEFSSIDFLWLKRNSSWPNLVKLAVYRFLHFHDLYQIDQDEKVKKLINYIFKEGELPNDAHCKEQMIHRCRKLILSTSQWTKNGLLTYNEENLLVKGAIFQNAWDNQKTIMRNRTALIDEEQPESTIIVAESNHVPLEMSESNSVVPEMCVTISSPVSEEKQDDPELITTDEPYIKVDPDGPVDLINKIEMVSQSQPEQSYTALGNPKSPLTPVLKDIPPNVTDDIYHCSTSYCHGMPDFESEIQDKQSLPPSTNSAATNVNSSQESISANVVFLKDSTRINYDSAALLLRHVTLFKAAAQLIVHTPNKLKRKLTREALSLIWTSNYAFLDFWKSVAGCQFTMIEFTFPDAAWLSGFTININNDDDIVRARQNIWNSFFMAIAANPEAICQLFRINARPKQPAVTLVPSKRPLDDTQDSQRFTRGGGDKGSSSNAGQALDASTAACEGNQSISQVFVSQKSVLPPKRSVLRQQKTSQPSTETQPNPGISLTNPINVELQMPQQQIPIPHERIQQTQMLRQVQQQQQQWSHPVQSLTGSHNFESQSQPQSHGFTQARAFEPNKIIIQPRSSPPLSEPVGFHNRRSDSYASDPPQPSPLTKHPSSESQVSLPMSHFIPNHRNTLSQYIPGAPTPAFTTSYLDPKQTPHIQASAPTAHQVAINAQNPSFPAHHGPQPSQLRPNYHPQASHIYASPLSPPFSPHLHGPNTNPTLNPLLTIQFRIQLYPNGPFSTPYPKSILGVPGKPPITTPELFAWFKNTTRMGHERDLGSLAFRLKDAVPGPVTYIISCNGNGNGDGVDALVKLRADIRRQCESAVKLIMGIEKFEIFVSAAEEVGKGKGVELFEHVLGDEW
ncbi:hypothetical protein EAF04_009882 [Stromatinia cepivora]|nr:hypothetical protein EAF04_009882 [Stromatinia cepivora]